jgi:DHA2 family multidrug resistance protein
MALIADLVDEAHRGKAMGVYNMTWNLGWIAGPTLGGFLSDRIGFPPTFLICVGLTVMGLILALIFIPAAVPKKAGAA